LARQIDPDRATPSAALAPDLLDPPQGCHTTHFSVIDRTGMAVANTYTLEQAFGSRVVVRGAGYLLNNEMGDFNHRPGVTDRDGQIGTPANRVAPGKRMLSSMCPTVVARDGKAVLVTGSPGGRTIINTVFCVVLNRLEFGMPLREAVDAPRQHHAWLPDVLRVEDALATYHAGALQRLRDMGHALGPPERQGDAHSIGVEARGPRYRGVADARCDGWAAGY
jgi:gamma-glutamyltranspeptidase/glutathione hydrolase